MLLAPLGIAGLTLAALQTPAAAWLVRPIIASQTGMQVRTGSVRVSPLGTITITDARFLAPGIDGPPGLVLRVQRVEARFDWASTLRGSPGITRLNLTGPELRLSQDVRTGVLNAAAFKIISGGGGGPTPSVRIQRGAIEVGEHDGATYTPLRRWNVVGDVLPADAAGVSSFSIAAMIAQDGAGPSSSGSLSLSGTLGPDGVRAQLDGLTLEDWPPSIVPSRLREVYARLALTGRLLPTVFIIDTSGRATVRMTLDGVDLNLPFNERYDIAGEGELLRMRQTRGTLEFGSNGLRVDVHGMIDELRYDVDLRYNGLSVDSPFEADLTTRFRMDDRFRPRRFLPPKAIEKLDMFESPTADVSAAVRVARASAGSEVTVQGRAEVANGRASYGKFRYPFTDLTATVVFSQDHLVIEEVRGRGPTGAILTGSGTFQSLGEDARVAIDLDVAGVPIDRHLMAALTTGRRQLVEALFNPERYAELIADGLVRTPEGLGGADAPLFDFGGAADVELRLRRVPERPQDDRWTRDTTVRLDRAGLVPEHFPLPIIARDIELRITDDELSLTGGRYEGLTGGEAFVEAELDQSTVRPGRDPLPVVEIFARGIPIDARFLAAIPGYRTPADPAQPVSLRSILDNLRVTGTVECRAVIGPRSDGELGYDVEANLFNANARPNAQIPETPGPTPSEPDPLVLAGMAGTVYVTERIIVVDFRGDLQSPARPLAPTPITLLTQLTLPERRGGLGNVARTGGLLPIQEGPPVPGPTIFANARAEGLDLAMPLEHAVAVVSPELAQRLASLRNERRPDGLLTLRTTIDGFVGGHTETTLALERINSLAVEHEGVRHRIGPSRGSMQIELGIHPSVSFRGFRVPVSSGGVDSGEIALDGQIPMIRPGDESWRPERQGLRIGLRQGRVESPATTQIVAAFAGTGTSEWLTQRRVEGSFDLDLELTPQSRTPAKAEPAEAIYRLPPLSAFGSLRPRTLALDLPESRIEFGEVQGSVLFKGLGGSVERLQAIAPGLTVAVDGPWTFEPGIGAGLDLTLDVSGQRLNESFRSLLPGVVLGVFDRFQIKAEGPIQAENLRVRGERLGSDDSSLQVSGNAIVSDASALVGVAITELSGRIDFSTTVTPEGTGFEIDLHADRLRAGKMRIEHANAAILSDPSRPGAVLIPEITGRLHGGRVAGSAQSHIMGDETRFWVDLHASDVRASPVFDDLLLPEEGLIGPPLPGEETVRSAWSVPDDFSRGLLNADLSLTGTAGRPERTAGRGVVRVAGGSIIALPGLINLIEFSNLRAPVGARLDLAEGEFFIDGTTVAFERLSASSRTVEIIGHGTMDLVSQEMDLRFRSRSIRPVPLFSALLEQIRDELITTRMSGRPGNLQYSTENFGSTRRLVRALIGDRETEQERVMTSVERASRAAKNRDPTKEAPVVLPTASPAAWADGQP